MMVISPIIAYSSLYIGVLYGIEYVLLTTIPIVFVDQYHWPQDLTGLAYLGLVLGYIIGICINGKLSDKIIVSMTKKNHDIYEPEFRLPLMMHVTVVMSISLFMYGWMAEESVHWMGPMIAFALFGIGILIAFVASQSYLIDAFPKYAASAVAAITIVRSAFGAFIPMAGLPLYDALGLGWGNTVLGVISLLTIPIPFLFYKYGKKMRAAHPVKF
jgi:MFS family permease